MKGFGIFLTRQKRVVHVIRTTRSQQNWVNCFIFLGPILEEY